MKIVRISIERNLIPHLLLLDVPRRIVWRVERSHNRDGMLSVGCFADRTYE